MTTNTVRVTNVSLKATAHDLQDFFSFSGEIENIELQRYNDTQIALVTFKEAQALDTALLLSGATVVDRAVNITAVEDELSPNVSHLPRDFNIDEGFADSNAQKPNQATDVIATMLAKGFILGKDAAGKAREFDEKHQLTASATSSVVNFDKKTGISEKIGVGSAVVNQQLKAVDEKYQVSERTRAAFAVAEEKVSTAGSALLKNRYVMTGATWVTGAFSRVQKAAAEVSQKAKEKAATMESGERSKGQFSEEEHRSPFYDSYGPPPPYPTSERAAVSLSSAAESASSRYPGLGYDHYTPLLNTEPPTTKPPPAQGLIL